MALIANPKSRAVLFDVTRWPAPKPPAAPKPAAQQPEAPPPAKDAAAAAEAKPEAAPEKPEATTEKPERGGAGGRGAETRRARERARLLRPHARKNRFLTERA